MQQKSKLNNPLQGHTQGLTCTGGLDRVKTATPYMALQWQVGNFSCHIAAEYS